MGKFHNQPIDDLTNVLSVFSPRRYGAGYSHAYGSEGYHHYMRQYDPSYDAFDPEGPSVDDRWRNTYPYVPTSFRANSDGGEFFPKKRSE